MRNRPRCEIRNTAKAPLSAAEREELWAFYSRFAECPEPTFMHLIALSDEVCRYYERADRRLVGFEASTSLNVTVDGRKTGVIVVQFAHLDPAVRGISLMPRVAMRKYLAFRLRHPLRPLYALFIASSYLSYMTVAHNFAEYWPRRGTPTPPHIEKLMDAVLRALGTENWDAAAGVVRRFGQVRYREGVVADDPDALQDPDIRFYAERNPGQADGDTLPCVLPMTLRNILWTGWHAILRRFSAR